MAKKDDNIDATLNDNDENIMIFMKRDFTNYYKPPIQFNNVWD